MKKYYDRTEEFRERAAELVSKMTLEEKVFQTLHTAPAIERLGVKSYNWWNEALHGVARAGVATIFPQAIGLAASFDEDLLYEVADAISTEGRAKFNMQQKFEDRDIYKGLTFWAPNVNIFRDPRWGRGHETFGEDPYLTSTLAVKYINGMQGDGEFMKVAACAKHFAVHSGPENIRHEFNAEVSEQDLRETYLPAFKASVKEAHVEAVMGAYNRVNGEPCCGSKTLLTDILRGEWGFEGHVTSDCGAIADFHERHRVTDGPVQSAAMAVDNGCDLNCGKMFFYLTKAVEDGLLAEEKLDEAVTRLFVARMKLGLFEEKDAMPYKSIDYTSVDSQKMRELNLETSKRTLVLLKNENNLLPLKKEKIKTIGIIGPNANSRNALVGNYEGTSSRYVTVLEGIQDYLGEEVNVRYSEGCHLYMEHVSDFGLVNDRISEVKAVCEESDIVIACFGLDAGIEGEEGDPNNKYASGDKTSLELPGIQKMVLNTIAESGKPVVLVLLSGSSLAVEEEKIPAILQAWYPGAQGGRAIAEILFGEQSPEGKLPVTFYRSTEDLPEFTDYSMKNRTYRYMEKAALYPFGYGLSYTSFSLEQVEVINSESKEGAIVKALITNRGALKGAETLQIYIKAPYVSAPKYQLKGLKKVRLLPGESKQVEIKLNKDAFGIFNEAGESILCDGEYKIYIGFNQPDERSINLTGHTPVCKVITL
ncbi:glycoside hydrolase family 3 C-terminal domain-containing protein [Anaerocolumna sp. AGMB13025]|uniref:glycoside hydrolase family 3 C-terminal domain-containing protein n=1 Tax=Anaerocolumna sp. AGMB13025 TaxID=3039116 RepID=UPI00241D6003|nr:glycoside hydrolase family 3 C-terminal domain-containing protein [Anaerocolumna sp. AGMB13025]WFR58562.1 glycoside hydrolase family 3 C-terminal domain-containing protein [Anaerocolumna sp. AGMB13025]